jgi:hypothetical protein
VDVDELREVLLGWLGHLANVFNCSFSSLLC